jgi:hypothetical protein
MMDGIASLPAEMAKGLRPLKPNREKIRTILSMSNVIDLQRQLLTTVMENEVSGRAHVCTYQGCQMVYFYAKNPILGIFWRDSEWKM